MVQLLVVSCQDLGVCAAIRQRSRVGCDPATCPSSGDVPGRFLPKELVAAGRTSPALLQAQEGAREPRVWSCSGLLGLVRAGARGNSGVVLQHRARGMVGCRWAMGLCQAMLSTGEVCFIQAQGSPA